MFEKASRISLRFDSGRGLLSVEDLWQLPLTSQAGKDNLDTMAVGLHRKLGESNLSFVNTPAVAAEDDQLRFNIIKHIISVKMAENAARALERSNSEKKQGLLALIAKKEGEALEGHSLEDLRKLVDELG